MRRRGLVFIPSISFIRNTCYRRFLGEVSTPLAAQRLFLTARRSVSHIAGWITFIVAVNFHSQSARSYTSFALALFGLDVSGRCTSVELCSPFLGAAPPPSRQDSRDGCHHRPSGLWNDHDSSSWGRGGMESRSACLGACLRPEGPARRGSSFHDCQRPGFVRYLSLSLEAILTIVCLITDALLSRNLVSFVARR